MLDYEAVPGLAPSKNLDKARKYVSAGKKAKLAHPANTSGMCVLTLFPSDHIVPISREQSSFVCSSFDGLGAPLWRRSLCSRRRVAPVSHL